MNVWAATIDHNMVRTRLDVRLMDLKMCLTFKKFVWRKKFLFGKKKKKKIENAFKGPKSLKMIKTYFWQKLKNEAFAIKQFLKLYFSNKISNMLLIGYMWPLHCFQKKYYIIEVTTFK